MYVSTTKDGYQEKQIGGQVAKMTFIEQDIDVNALYDLLINGHSIQCCFGIEGEYHPLKGRNVKKDRFKQTNIVSVDLDDIAYSWIELKAVISSVLPTIMYTTYNHIIEGNRYRLLYCFDEPIYSVELYRALYNSIKSLLNKCGVVITDNCGHTPYQMMNGTTQSANDFHSKNYNKVFSFSSFLTEEQLQAIPNIQSNNKHKVALCTNIVKESNNTNVVSFFVQEATPIDESLIRDANKLSYEVFWHYYRKKYHYIYRKEKSDWIDYKYQFIDDDYIRCDYRVKKLKDGEGRKEWLFKQALIRRYISPDIDIDTLFYCMVIDWHRFIDNSVQPITIEELVRRTTNAFQADIYEGSRCISSAKAKAPKSGIILRQGTYKNVGDYMHQISLIKEQYGGKRCRMTLYKERKAAGEVVARNTDKDYAEIYDKIDVSLSRNANLKALKDMGYKVGKNKVSELLNKKLSKENNTFDQVN